MSAYSSTSWLDSLYVSSPVFSQMRADYGEEANGVIYGFPQDTQGAVIQFSQGDKFVRFFITFEELQIAWRNDGVYRINQANVKLVGVFPKKDLVLGEGKSTSFVRVNRFRVPLYTCYV